MLNNNIITAKITRLQGLIKEGWGKFTNNDNMLCEGRRMQFFGKMSEKYNLTKEEAKARIAKFVEESKGAQCSTFKY